MKNDRFAAKLAALDALRANPDANVVPALRKALSDRSNFIVAKAAAVLREAYLTELIPDVLAAFDRLLATLKTTPAAAAKTRWQRP